MIDDSFTDAELIALRPALMAFSRSFVRSPNDMDDLVQETLSRALTYRYQFRRGTKLKSWLFTIMRNTFYNDRVRRHREQPGADDCIADLRSVPAPQESARQLTEIAQRIEQLPDDFRISLLMVASGETCEYVAERCGCAVGTVKSRVSRARRMLEDGKKN